MAESKVDLELEAQRRLSRAMDAAVRRLEEPGAAAGNAARTYAGFDRLAAALAASAAFLLKRFSLGGSAAPAETVSMKPPERAAVLLSAARPGELQSSLIKIRSALIPHQTKSKRNSIIALKQYALTAPTNLSNREVSGCSAIKGKKECRINHHGAPLYTIHAAGKIAKKKYHL